jgi:hypothetical protein
MSVLNELKEMHDWAVVEATRCDALVQRWMGERDTYLRRAEDLDRAIAALEPALTDEQPELFEAEQEVASEQLASDHALPPSADDVVVDEPVEFISDLTGDPAIEPMLEPQEPYPEADPLPQPEWNEPQTEGYAPVVDQPPTNPEADALAKAHDWYDPKAVHDRQKFNPWGIFKRETEDA